MKSTWCLFCAGLQSSRRERLFFGSLINICLKHQEPGIYEGGLKKKSLRVDSFPDIVGRRNWEVFVEETAVKMLGQRN